MKTFKNTTDKLALILKIHHGIDSLSKIYIKYEKLKQSQSQIQQ